MEILSYLGDRSNRQDIERSNKYLNGKKIWDGLSKDDKHNLFDYFFGVVWNNTLVITIILIIGWVVWNYSFLITTVQR